MLSSRCKQCNQCLVEIDNYGAQLAQMAFAPYDTFIARVEALKDGSFAEGMAITTKRQSPRAIAQSASGATKRKSGVVRRRTKSKKAKGKRR